MTDTLMTETAAASAFRPFADLAELLLRTMPAGLELVVYEIDEWASMGAVAQLHRVRLQVTPGRMDDLAALAGRLEGCTIGGATILEAEAEDLGGNIAVVHALTTD